MNRVPEPELMTDAEQAEAYARADFAEVNQGFVDRFRALFPDLLSGAVLDLGCGPADIPIRLARALPEVTVTAVDGSEAMIALARRAVKATRVHSRVHLLCQRLPGLNLRPNSFHAIVSNSLLHHLPSPTALWLEAERLGRPGAAVLVMDLHRPDSPERARQIVEQYAAGEAPVLKQDFFNSLCAAFTLGEVRDQVRGGALRGLRCEMVSDRHWAAWGRLARDAG